MKKGNKKTRRLARLIVVFLVVKARPLQNGHGGSVSFRPCGADFFGRTLLQLTHL
jgi:hypothetical protein